MKKMFIMAAMAVCATTAFAQDDLVKQAEKLAKSGDLKGAITTITPALTSDQTTNKAKAWNVLSSAHYDYYFKQFEQDQKNKIPGAEQVAIDEAGMNEAFIASFEAALKCDEYDRQPNEKGKVKTKFRSSNSNRFANMRVVLINAGQYYYNQKDYTTAVKAWKLYIDSASDPLFSETELGQDQYRGDICYYIGMGSYMNKDYATAIKYAKMAAEDPTKAADANEIILFAQKDGAKTKEDSLAYLQTVKEFHKQNPNEPRYFNLLVEYFNKSGKTEEMHAWISEEVALYPDNKMAWALKGENENNAGKTDDAIASYKKAIELDPTFVQVVFNLGVCMNTKAIELKDQLADKNSGGLTPANAEKVKAVLEEAKTYLLKVKDMDPNREKVNWVYPLYQIYYALGDTANASEMEKMLNQ